MSVAKELFNKDFDFTFQATTYNNMKVALKAFEQFKKDNETFFSFDKKETVFGHLRTYSIEKQFNDSAFNPKANYAVSMKQVNNFRHKGLFIDTENFILNIGSTNKPEMLLPKSKYKMELAKANAGMGSQLSFEFMEQNIEIVEAKKYAEIVYGYKNGEITHLQIVLPSSQYNCVEYSINLLENIKIYDNYVPEEIVEESIVTLKEQLVKKIK